MILTLDCEGSAHLTSESLDRPLNWAEKLAVKFHRMICSKSRRLNRQIIQMHKQLSKMASDQEEPQTSIEGLSDSARSRIETELDRLQND